MSTERFKQFLFLLLRYVASWIDQRERQTERAHLTILFEKYVPRCLEQMRKTFRPITPIPENSMVQVLNTEASPVVLVLLWCAFTVSNFFLIVQTLCTLLDCLLTPENIPSDSPRELYETYFTFACIWAFGGALYQDQVLLWFNSSRWNLIQSKIIFVQTVCSKHYNCPHTEINYFL